MMSQIIFLNDMAIGTPHYSPPTIPSKAGPIIRELGKVVGLPKADIDAIVDAPLANEKHHPYARHIFRYGEMIAMKKTPNHSIM